MASGSPSAFDEFQWEPQPKAQALVNELVEGFLARCPSAALLSKKMEHETGTRFGDWIDQIQAPRDPALRARLLSVGFDRRAVPGATDCFVHDKGMFPRIILDSGKTTKVWIKVESVIDFLAAWRIADDPTTGADNIAGEPLAPMRQARAFQGEPAPGADPAELWVIERHGYRGFTVPKPDADRAMLILKHSEALRRRNRDFPDDAQAFDHADAIVDAAIADLGPDLACDLFFAAEREYWQRRNLAAQIQKARQDKLGLGWANHDHHTYRSSREWFTRTVALFEKLGFVARERFYAGHEAGWGAQVLEQPEAGITIFADVDLTPDEIAGNFAHEPLVSRDVLGTVGLWCGLHGESILQAGMHHLECQFRHDALVDQLEAAHIKTMAPFTDFPFLKQAFTAGERWPVSGKRIQRLVDTGLITTAQAFQFRSQGAIGSHLENLERNDGYKGFNQKGVSEIIAKTDPRHHDELIGA